MEIHLTGDENLTLTGDKKKGVGDLQVIRGEFAGSSVIRSHWKPDEGELRALVHGAPLRLDVWTAPTRVPPVGLTVGEPELADDAEPMLNLQHVARALGWLHQALDDRENEWRQSNAGETIMGDPDQADHFHGSPLPPPPDFYELWQQALAETREPPTAQHGAPEVDE